HHKPMLANLFAHVGASENRVEFAGKALCDLLRQLRRTEESSPRGKGDLGIAQLRHCRNVREQRTALRKERSEYAQLAFLHQRQGRRRGGEQDLKTPGG